MKPNRAFIFRAFVRFAALALLATAGCDNMKHQRNVRALEPSPHFADGASARTPPAHTLARDELTANDPFATGLAAATDGASGAPLAEFPIPLTRDLLARGRERFNIHCAVCHGEDGYGRGIVVRRGFPAPPSLHDERLRTAPVGHFVNVIARGYGVMFSYADRVEPSDRWAIAAYVRALQRSQHATLADVPAGEREKLSAP